jgi:hypothetical protein
MPRYATQHQTAVGTTLTMVNVTGAAAVRPKWYDFIIGSDAGPTDLATEFNVTRTTDVGAGGTALAESPLDPLSVAATGAALGGTFAGTPTAGPILMNIALNQRATFRWVAAPGSELITVATAANGIELYSAASGGTANHNFTIMWEE